MFLQPVGPSEPSRTLRRWRGGSPVRLARAAATGVRDVAAIPGFLVAEVATDVGAETEAAGRPTGYLGHVIAAGSSPGQSRRRAAYLLDGIHVDVEALQRV